MNFEEEKTESGKERFISGILSNFNQTAAPIKGGKEIKYVPVLYQCSVCGAESVDESQEYPEGSVARIIECDDCLRKREDSQRNDDYMKMVPKRYRQAMTFEGEQALLEKDCSLIYGPYGTGKTWTAYALARRLYMDRTIGKFLIVREAKLLQDVRGGLGYQYESCDLLVIDEYGKGSNTEFAKAEIFNIIDARYDEMRRTVLICNAKDEKELVEAVPFAVLDRYRQNIVFIGGQSRRPGRNQ